jgi:hypothetical protein
MGRPDAPAQHRVVDARSRLRSPDRWARETRMLGPIGRVAQGIAAGCAGIVALEVASYADQYLKGRAASKTPTRLGEGIADRAGIELGEGRARTNRASALGPIAGYADGVLLGIAWAVISAHPVKSLPKGALLLTAGAWAGSNVPLMSLGITDPRRWTPQDWQSDLVPHAAYGATTALMVALLR